MAKTILKKETLSMASELAKQSLQQVADNDCRCAQLLMMSAIFMSHHNPQARIRNLIEELEQMMDGSKHKFRDLEISKISTENKGD